MTPELNKLVNCKYKNSRGDVSGGTGKFITMSNQFAIFCIEGNGEVPVKLSNILELNYVEIPQPKD